LIDDKVLNEAVEDLMVNVLLNLDTEKLTMLEQNVVHLVMFKKEMSSRTFIRVKQLNSKFYGVPRFAKNFGFAVACYILYLEADSPEFNSVPVERVYSHVLRLLSSVKSKKIEDYRKLIIDELQIEMNEQGA